MRHWNHHAVKAAIPAALLLVTAAGPATANQITLYPDDNTPDTADPLGVQDDFAPGYQSGSFQANGSDKTAVYVGADALFGGSTVTIGDLQSLSYATKQDVPDSGTPVNWYIEVYTKADGTDDDSFYGRRLNLEPYFSQNRNEPDNTWVRWSTDGVGSGSENKLRVFDANRGDSGDVFGTYTDPFLGNLTSGPINWSDYNDAYVDAEFDYTSEVIDYIGISTGSAWADGFDGQVDGFSVGWDGGNSAETSTVNLEAAAEVPEPPVLALFLAGIAGMLLVQQRRA